LLSLIRGGFGQSAATLQINRRVFFPRFPRFAERMEFAVNRHGVAKRKNPLAFVGARKI